ncbi:MAG: RNA methyltransferase [Betaproteobacteria bacterium SG8_39]|nr:MAG: RNA methyltransferase [Betaproteobacteria bacterium SG8_39]
MAYDAALAVRVRTRLARAPGLAERSMFGGLCFLVNGHMCAGIVGDTLMLRVGPERYAEALARPHAREMDFTGRPLKGMIYVDPPGIASGAALGRWLGMAIAFVQSEPTKKATKKKPPTRRKARQR